MGTDYWRQKRKARGSSKHARSKMGPPRPAHQCPSDVVVRLLVLTATQPTPLEPQAPVQPPAAQPTSRAARRGEQLQIPHLPNAIPETVRVVIIVRMIPGAAIEGHSRPCNITGTPTAPGRLLLVFCLAAASVLPAGNGGTPSKGRFILPWLGRASWQPSTRSGFHKGQKEIQGGQVVAADNAARFRLFAARACPLSAPAKRTTKTTARVFFTNMALRTGEALAKGSEEIATSPNKLLSEIPATDDQIKPA
ncbi:hypothetical protein MAPG_10624 [Magnaporthiopsis poae ATCC 64411]|uniref:Uncharacterized protein n=1 Tax=Magnaporthiopsis poae (strain ATCC 64411 / 73-15) TaxID=644358 RepID=A0A0C4ED31_MAGP6|nr:hypothetical protein MAPG_10624 [Magnaporthiopsis poae ATCC 64411]